MDVVVDIAFSLGTLRVGEERAVGVGRGLLGQSGNERDDCSGEMHGVGVVYLRAECRCIVLIESLILGGCTFSKDGIIRVFILPPLALSRTHRRFVLTLWSAESSQFGVTLLNFLCLILMVPASRASRVRENDHCPVGSWIEREERVAKAVFDRVHVRF